MILEVRFRPEAELDLADAALWHEGRQPQLGHDFFDEVLSVLSTAAGTPLIYPLVHRNTRRAVTRRFPFWRFLQSGNHFSRRCRRHARQ